MKIKDPVRDFILKVSDKKLISKKKLTTSYVSLFLIFTILVGATISWFTFQNTATVDSDTFTLESASGLRVNEGEDITNHISLDNIKLDEASSVDGRNMFFPLSEYGDTVSSKTSDMLFREGNVGDKNVKYVYRDFTLKGDSGITDVYVKSYSIKITEDNGTVIENFTGNTEIIYQDDGNGNKIPVAQTVHKECPVRIAFITDSSDVPQVIDPTALVDYYVNDYNAVSSNDDSGVPTTAVSTGESFANYYFLTGSPMFRLYENQPLDVTMVVWLEGTENVETGISNSELYAGKNISIEINLESNWADNETIYFVDDTIGAGSTPETGFVETQYWITTDFEKGNSLILMTYTDNNGDTKTVVMQKAPTTINGNTAWYASIPKNVTTNISFFRYDINKEMIFNAWHTKVNVNSEMADKGKQWIDAYYKRSLDESRDLSDGTHSIIYTALRDNGNGDVDENDPNFMKLRLAPGIGYWNWSGPPSDQDETTVAPTQGTTSSQEDTTAPIIIGERDKFSIFLSLREDDTWVQKNLANGYKLYVLLADGNSYELNKSSDNYYTLENAYGSRGTSFKEFYISNGIEKNELSLEKSIPLVPNGETGFNYNFTMQTNNIIKYNG